MTEDKQKEEPRPRRRMIGLDEIKLAERSIRAYFDVLDGCRVVAHKPDGLSLPMGPDDDRDGDFHEWAFDRVDQALSLEFSSAILQKDVEDYLKAHYRNGQQFPAKPDLEWARAGYLVGRAVRAVIRNIGRNPMPKGLEKL